MFNKLAHHIVPSSLKNFLAKRRADRIRKANLRFLDWCLRVDLIDEDGYERLKSGDLSEYLHHTQVGLDFK